MKSRWCRIRFSFGLVLPPELPRCCILLVSLLVSGLMVVKTTHENRFAFNQLQVLREEANQLDVEWGQLLLEQSTFGLGGRIEQKATRELQLQVPRISDIVMVNLNEKQP